MVTHLIAQNATTSGSVTTPYPTVTNLAVEWQIEGDDNLNGVVAVQYRKSGENEWHEAMALRRVPAGKNLGFSWENKHSGSIFNLEPGTAYTIKLTLADPDGGSAEQIVSVTTRRVPRIPAGAIIKDIPTGTYSVLTPENGTETSPRVYRSLDGSAVYDFVDLQNKQWVYLWGLTIKSSGENSARAIKANGAKNCVIRYCTISGLYGITAYGDGLTNCYIGDNIVTGINVWNNAAMGADGDNDGEGIQFTGPGNVICHNRVSGFRDDISTMEDKEAKKQICIDIYNNDLFTGVDDGIEADFCFNNCRIMRNRITNCYVGLSSQPGLGGPTYFIRNVMYNVVHAAFKFKRDSRGDVALHNTIVKIGAGLAGNDAMDFAFFRNNLAFGGPNGNVNWGGYGAGNPYAADIRDPGSHSSFDYDAVGIDSVNYVAKIGSIAFDKIEQHGVGNLQFDEVFPDVEFPYPPVPERKVPDLRPHMQSAVIDKGLPISNINHGYSGTAPDCGAYEVGQDLPVYGPRPEGTDEGSNVIVPGCRTDRLYGNRITVTVQRQFVAVKCFSGVSEAVSIELFNVAGSRVASRSHNVADAGVHDFSISTQQLSSGWYLLRLNIGTGSYTQGFFLIH